MIQTVVIISIFCAAMNTVTQAFMNMNTRELYNLHNWRDFCSMGLTPGQRQGSAVKGAVALDQFCLNAFEGWKEIGGALQERCPQAREPKCRPWKGSNKCTVQIKASNKSDTMRIVELAYCAQGVDWDSVMTENGRLRPKGQGSEIE